MEHGTQVWLLAMSSCHGSGQLVWLKLETYLETLTCRYSFRRLESVQRYRYSNQSMRSLTSKLFDFIGQLITSKAFSWILDKEEFRINLWPSSVLSGDETGLDRQKLFF